MPTLEEYRKQAVTLESLGIGTATEEDLVTAPLEGLDFGAGSWIANWSIGRYYYFQTDEDYLIYNRDAAAEDRVPAPDLLHKPKDTFHLFYRDRDVAKRVNTALNGDDAYPPRYMWVFTAPTVSIKNAVDIQKIASTFSDTLCFWVRIEALEKGHTRNQFGNRSSRHEYNFISLPSAVAAIAAASGYTVPEYDLSPLTAPGAEDNFDDEFFAKYMGPSDGDYAGTFYDTQRAKLWKALGEDDPRKTSMIGSYYMDKNGNKRPDPLATESEKLSSCLVIAQKDVNIWARLVNVPNPREGRFRIPAITEIFVNEEHASLVAQAEMAERGAESGAPIQTHPPLSGGWAGGKPSDVVSYLKENGLVPLPENVPPPERVKLVEASYLGSWDDLVAWGKYIAEQG